MGADNLDELRQVYSPDTWGLYQRLDRSLDPCGPASLLDLALSVLRPGDRILDAGCRDAAHLIQLVQQTRRTRGVGVDPVSEHVTRAVAAVQAAGLSDRITVQEGDIHDLPHPDASFELLWCRDVLEQVDPLEPALVELARVAVPGARLIVFTTVLTELADERDTRLLRQHRGNVHRNLDRGVSEAAFRGAGWQVERVEPIGTAWREHAEERTQPVSRKLLQLARLRRQREALLEIHGRATVEHVEANLHWELFQFLGKLLPIVYILRAPRSPSDPEAEQFATRVSP